MPLRERFAVGLRCSQKRRETAGRTTRAPQYPTAAAARPTRSVSKGCTRTGTCRRQAPCTACPRTTARPVPTTRLGGLGPRMPVCHHRRTALRRAL
eukprot:1139574-Rhodomonas_salina.2